MNASLPWLVVPMRSFSRGKRRLEGMLDCAARRRLNEEFLAQLLRQATVWPGLGYTVVVSPCQDVLCAARAAGAFALRQPSLSHLDETNSATLNAALEFARQELQCRRDSDLLVVSSDLPFADAADFQRATAASSASPESQVVIVMDRAREGTNALFVPRSARLPFCFGPHSAQRHADAAQARQIAWTQTVLPSLALDVDTPADLALWQQLKRERS